MWSGQTPAKWGFRSGWHLVTLWVKVTFGQMLPPRWLRLTFGQTGQVDILQDSQSASQLQLASQLAMWQIFNLSTSGGSDSWWGYNWGLDHTGPQSRVPLLPLVSLWGWPTWSRPGKSHKWALQLFIYHWHYVQGPFAVFYLPDLIIYSSTKCIEML